jgi:hypothetical protein
MIRNTSLTEEHEQQFFAEVISSTAAALPLDVRRWLSLAVTRAQRNGLCPWFGLGPFEFHLRGTGNMELLCAFLITARSLRLLSFSVPLR